MCHLAASPPPGNLPSVRGAASPQQPAASNIRSPSPSPPPFQPISPFIIQEGVGRMMRTSAPGVDVRHFSHSRHTIS